ncbi:COG1470 family protein [Streptomyces sp. NPDC054794]
MPSAARALCLSLLTLLATAPQAAAAWGSPLLEGHGGWSLAPAGGGRPSFYAEGTPGTVLRDTVSVTNPGGKPVTVRLRGTGVRVTFAGTRLRVPARTRADVPFTLAVPAQAAPGDRPAAITARDDHGRTATVPVRLRVTGPALSALTVEHVAVHADRITYDLVNRGTTVLVPTLAVRADGVFGRVLDRAPRTLPVRLAPGRRLTLDEPWHGRPALDAVDVRLTVTAEGGARDSAEVSARFVPWGAVALGAGLVSLAGAGLVVRHRGRRGRRGPEPEPTTASEGARAELTGAVR